MMRFIAVLVMAIAMALGAATAASATTVSSTPMPEASSSAPTDDPTVPENGTPCAASITEGESPTEGVWLDGQCVVSDSYPEPTPTSTKASAPKPKPASQPELAKTGGSMSPSVIALAAGTAIALGSMFIIAARRPNE